MQDTLVMRGGQTGAELPRDFDGLVMGGSAHPAKHGREILAVDVFHGDVVLTVGVANAVDTADVGVRDLSCDAHFVVEAFQLSSVLREGGRQEFQRHRLAQLQVVGPSIPTMR